MVIQEIRIKHIVTPQASIGNEFPMCVSDQVYTGACRFMAAFFCNFVKSFIGSHKCPVWFAYNFKSRQLQRVKRSQCKCFTGTAQQCTSFLNEQGTERLNIKKGVGFCNQCDQTVDILR